MLIQWIRNPLDCFIKVFGSVNDVDPDRAYNMDETPKNPDTGGAYHIIPKDAPRSDRISTECREFFACVACVSASV
jgi:hypothetical protein